MERLTRSIPLQMQLQKKIVAAAIATMVLAMVILKPRSPESRPQSPPPTLSGENRAPATAMASTQPYPDSSPVEPEVSPVPTTTVGAIATRLRNFLEDEDPATREQQIAELDALLSGTNGLTILGQLPPDLINFALGLPTFQSWLADDPRAAAAWLSSQSGISEARVNDLIHDWSAKDPVELQQYLASLPAGEWKQKAFAVAGEQLVENDPVAAIDLAREMDSDPQQVGILEQATAQWAKSDFDSATQWAGQISDAALRERLLATAAVGLAANDPARGATELLRSVQSDELFQKSAAEIAGVWAEQNPMAAGEWVANLPETGARQSALANLVNVWGGQDRAGLADWIAGLPQNLLRMDATSFFSELPAPNSTP